MHQLGPTDQLRVLVADDDPIQRSLVGTRLAALNGTMVEAEDGLVAWELLTSQTFDMAIVDLGMPNLDGIALIRCMRGHPRTRHLPIIVITSRDDKPAIEEAYAAGASSFLIEPVVSATLEHLVGFLLRLVQAERKSRTDFHKAAALGRAKETLLLNLTEETTATVDEIRRQVDRLIALWSGPAVPAFLVNQLDRISAQCIGLRDFAGRINTALEVVNDTIIVDSRKVLLVDIIDQVLGKVDAIANDAGVSVILEAGADAFLSCDAEAIELALAHLVENAIAHSPAAEAVHVSTHIFPRRRAWNRDHGCRSRDPSGRHWTPHYDAAPRRRGG